MQITNFNDQTLLLIRRDLTAALKQINEKYGINLSPAGIHFRYSDNRVTTKFELTIPEAGAATRPTGNLNQYVGKYYKMKRRVFQITGIQDNKLVGLTQNGKGYLLTEAQVMTMALAAKPAVPYNMHSRYRQGSGGRIEG